MIDASLLQSTEQELEDLKNVVLSSGIMKEYRDHRNVLFNNLRLLNNEIGGAILQSSIKHSKKTGNIIQVARFIVDNNKPRDEVVTSKVFLSDGVDIGDGSIVWNIPLIDVKAPETVVYCIALLVVVNPETEQLLDKSYVLSKFDGSGDELVVVERDTCLYYYELVRATRLSRTGNTLSVELRI